jgi:3-phytase
LLFEPPTELFDSPVSAAPAAFSVRPSVETPPLFDDESGGNANGDDPAIWVHPTAPDKSLIIVTKKEAGLSVYDLQGNEIQNIAPPPPRNPDDSPGRFNNVDILRGFELGDKRVDVAVTTDRGNDTIRFYVIDPRAAASQRPPLTDVTDPAVPFVFSADQNEVNAQSTAYGLAVMSGRDDEPPVLFATRRHHVQVARLTPLATNNGRITYRRVDVIDIPYRFRLPNGATWSPCQSNDDELPQLEGMVVDTEREILYMAQEDVGIWALPIAARRARLRLVDRVREFGVPYDRVFDPAEEEFICTTRLDRDPGFGGRHLAADAEGLTIYYGRSQRGYLLASSQGDSTFAVYDRSDNNAFVTTFRVTDGNGIDGAQHSDGAAVTNASLGAAFPHGLFVTHDGENTPDVLAPDGTARVNTNFKLVRWEDIARSSVRPLMVDSGDDADDDN